MKSVTIMITNENGLHARPASLLVKCTTQYKSKITITSNGEKVDAKSIMGIILLAAEKGRNLYVEIDGPDEDIALENFLKTIIDKKFCEA
ncbi:MAG: HPr family phosphocarrier protein [Fusobacteria bacterium]|nr:HPr family phosphocarrier protein [Fusobacteriota bacterium]